MRRRYIPTHMIAYRDAQYLFLSIRLPLGFQNRRQYALNHKWWGFDWSVLVHGIWVIFLNGMLVSYATERNNETLSCNLLRKCFFSETSLEGSNDEGRNYTVMCCKFFWGWRQLFCPWSWRPYEAVVVFKVQLIFFGALAYFKMSSPWCFYQVLGSFLRETGLMS
jgi:hypothetical protein